MIYFCHVFAPCSHWCLSLWWHDRGCIKHLHGPQQLCRAPSACNLCTMTWQLTLTNREKMRYDMLRQVKLSRLDLGSSPSRTPIRQLYKGRFRWKTQSLMKQHCPSIGARSARVILFRLLPSKSVPQETSSGRACTQMPSTPDTHHCCQHILQEVSKSPICSAQCAEKTHLEAKHVLKDWECLRWCWNGNYWK